MLSFSITYVRKRKNKSALLLNEYFNFTKKIHKATVKQSDNDIQIRSGRFRHMYCGQQKDGSVPSFIKIASKLRD